MLTLVAAGALPAPARAQTCAVSITDTNFGSSVDTLSGTATDTSATLSYGCSGGAASARVLICVHLGDGSVPAAGGYRRMIGGSSYLSYQLYQSADRTVVWGSAASGYPPPPIEVVLDGSGAASGQTAIFGRLMGGQSTVEAASYLATFAGGQVDVRYRVTDDNDCSSLLGTSDTSASFDVKAVVVSNCLVATEPVNFGSHGVLGSNIDSTGSVLVKCTPATDYTIRLDGGGADAAPTARQMIKGAEAITYGLYRNGARDQPWGDTEGTTAAGSGNGGFQTHVVYGRVPPQTTPTAGLYTDTVVVTVDY